jgi:hypothetical protein
MLTEGHNNLSAVNEESVVVVDQLLIRERGFKISQFFLH